MHELDELVARLHIATDAALQEDVVAVVGAPDVISRVLLRQAARRVDIAEVQGVELARLHLDAIPADELQAETQWEQQRPRGPTVIR